MCSTVTFDSATRRIFPSVCMFARASTDALRGMAGSGTFVQLVDVDSIKAQSSQAAFYRFTQVRRTCIMGPLVRLQDDSIPLWSRSRDPWGMERGLRRSTLR